ncbi:hypothetical protein [Pseudochrobactrum sp. B5]|uniref:hypothetical protein n=1 Tax=Pseudochrobactrum sp. B5 TaxID=1289478 RepID=UPI00095240BB|nr:hypothetical protein [Pseudochrobactrum sp. B5]
MKAIAFTLLRAGRAEAIALAGTAMEIGAALLAHEMLMGFQRPTSIAEAWRHSGLPFMRDQLCTDAADRTAVGFCRRLLFPTRRTFQRRPAGKRLPLEKDTAATAFDGKREHQSHLYNVVSMSSAAW